MSYHEVLFQNCTPGWLNTHKGLSGNGADVWKVFVPDYRSEIEDLVVILTEDERDKSSRFHQAKHTEEFIVRRALLRILLSKYLATEPDQIVFFAGENKKPQARQTNMPAVYFNVSHSDDLIVFAFANSEIGIDVERVNSSYRYQDILDHSFQTEEIQSIENSMNPPETFFKLWTRKEALVKTTAKGLDDDIRNIPSLDGIHKVNSELLGCNEALKVSTFTTNEQYMVSVAHQGQLNVSFYNVANILAF